MSTMNLLVVALVVGVFGVFLASWVGSAAWVYRDARRRNVDSAAYWGLGTLVTGYFGITAYIFVQGSSRGAALRGSAD